MTCSHPPQREHESMNAVEELMWMLTLFGHQNFSGTRGRANKKQAKIKGQEAMMYMSKRFRLLTMH